MVSDNQHPDYMKQTDEELIKEFQNEDIHAFDEIVIRYMDKIVNFLYQYTRNIEDAEEIAQDSFMKFYKYKDSYKEGRKFSTWLYTIALNNAKNKFKKTEQYELISIEELDEEEIENINFIMDPIAEYDSDDEDKLEIQYLRDAFTKLDDTFREVILLRYHESYDYEKISEILNIPIGTVKSRINRGRERVKEILSEITKSKKF